MGVIFGGGNSSVFGSTGAGGILAKLTALMGVIFVITSLSYTYVTSSRPESESQILDVRIEDIPAPEAERSATQTPAVAPEQKSVAPEAASPAPTNSESQPPANPAAPKDADSSATDSGASQTGDSATESQKPTDAAPADPK